MDLTMLIGQYAFPIAACCAMGYYVKYITDEHTKERNMLQKSHEEAEATIREAILNNTIVMTKICERIGEEFNGHEDERKVI